MQMSYIQMMERKPKETFFKAILGKGREEKFSLQECLQWREKIGMPIARHEQAELVGWLNADNNNFGRVAVWHCIQQMKREVATK